MTIREFKGSFDGLKMCYIGDGNNMANSLIVGGLKVGMTVSAATPENYRPAKEVMDFAADFDCFTITDDPKKQLKMLISFLQTYGLPWVRKAKLSSVKKRLRVIR